MAARHSKIGMDAHTIVGESLQQQDQERLFDEQRLGARTGQHGERLREFAALLLEHVPADLDALRVALNRGELARVAQSAHKLAGTFAALAIDPLVTESIAIEEAAGAGDITHCIALVNKLDARCEQVTGELSCFVASTRSA